MSTYYVYIFSNRTKTIFSIGFTNDLDKKFKEFNSDFFFSENIFEKKAKTIYLLYYKIYPSYKSAKEASLILRNKSRLKQEIEIKTMNPKLDFLKI